MKLCVCGHEKQKHSIHDGLLVCDQRDECNCRVFHDPGNHEYAKGYNDGHYDGVHDAIELLEHHQKLATEHKTREAYHFIADILKMKHGHKGRDRTPHYGIYRIS